jgi:hypothetical protein
MIKREDLKDALVEKTMCDIQHDGWPCGTCFFAIDVHLRNQDWQTLLLYRGDYKETELDNLPPLDDRENIIDKIYNLATH